MISIRGFGIRRGDVLCVPAAVGCSHIAQTGHIFDEAKQVGRTVHSFPAAGEDYFHNMDGAGWRLRTFLIRNAFMNVTM